MEKIKICDHCGAVITTTEADCWATIAIGDEGMQCDLCEKCARWLKVWMNNHEIKEREKSAGTDKE